MHSDPRRTTPIGLLRYAQEFLDCAIAADETVGMRPGYELFAPVPAMYLVGHSIELSLKSFLVSRGVPLKDLPTHKYGHNLMKIIKKAKELGLGSLLTLNTSEIAALEVLNDLYCSKQLNYIVTGEKRFPSFGAIQTIGNKMVDAIGTDIGYKVDA